MSEQKPPSPSPQFIGSIKAAVACWRERTEKTDDETIHQLDAERQNLFQAVQFGLALPQTQYDTVMVALQSFDLVERRGYWEEWITVLAKALASCPDKHQHLKFELLSRMGQLQRLNQRLPAAIETHQKAKSLAQQLGDKRSLSIANANLSEDYLRQREYIKAEKYGYAALTALSELENMTYWEAATLNTLGEAAQSRGNLVTSEDMLLQAVMIRRKLGISIALTRTLNKLANTLQIAGKLNEALLYYEEAIELLAETSYELDKTGIQINLGALYFQLEQYEKAEFILRQIDFAYLGSNKTHYEAAVMQSLGNILLKQNRSEEAVSYLQHAVLLWQEISEEIEQANSMETLGEAFVVQGQIAQAISLYEEAITLLKKFPGDARAQRLLAEFKLGWKQLATEN